MIRQFAFTAALLLGAAGYAQEADSTLRFAFLTDTHLSAGSHSIADLRRCIADINSQPDLDFAVFGGDITDFGADEEIRMAKAMIDSLQLPYYVVAGNHDAKWSESGCNTFKNVFGYEHFEFRKGGWRFLGCNCGPDMRMAPALLPKDSMDWLKGLEADERSIFFNHYPQDTSVLNYFEVTRALKRAGVRFEIGGHWHQNRAMNYDGLPAVLCRSTMTDRTRPAGYTLFTLSGNTVRACERRLPVGSPAETVQWYERELAPVQDTVSYDADGIAASYPWIRYDVNSKYTQVREVWRHRDNANIVAGFARRGGRAWYATASGTVRCIRIRDGHELWSRDFPGKIFSTPAVSGCRLVFGCTDGCIYALDARNGRTRWSVRAGKSVLASPVIRKGVVYIGASDGKFRALKLRSGAPVWTFDGVEGFVECRACVDEQQVVFGSWAGKLWSLDTRTGELQWTWNCGKSSRMYSPAATWPVKAAGRIFIANPDRKVYAINATTGEQLFSVNGGREAIGLSSDGGTVLAKTMFNTSYAFRADVPVPEGGELPDSALLWRVPNGMHYEIGPTPIVELDGGVITPSDKGNLFSFSMKDGSLQWCHKFSLALINPVETWKKGRSKYILASAMDGTIVLLKYQD